MKLDENEFYTPALIRYKLSAAYKDNYAQFNIDSWMKVICGLLQYFIWRPPELQLEHSQVW